MNAAPFKQTLQTLKTAPLYFLLLQVPQAFFDIGTTFISVDQRPMIDKLGLVVIQLIIAEIISGFSFASLQIVKKGEPLKFSQAFLRFKSRFWLLIGAALIVGTACAAGFMALILPGFIIMTLYIFVPYFLLEEDIPLFTALRRSMLLSQKYFLSTFLRVMGFGLIHFLNVTVWDYFIGQILHQTDAWLFAVAPYVLFKFATILVLGSVSEVYMPYYFFKLREKTI